MAEKQHFLSYFFYSIIYNSRADLWLRPLQACRLIMGIFAEVYRLLVKKLQLIHHEKDEFQITAELDILSSLRTVSLSLPA